MNDNVPPTRKSFVIENRNNRSIDEYRRSDKMGESYVEKKKYY